MVILSSDIGLSKVSAFCPWARYFTLIAFLTIQCLISGCSVEVAVGSVMLDNKLLGPGSQPFRSQLLSSCCRFFYGARQLLCLLSENNYEL